MSSRDLLAQLSSVAEKEVARLARLEGVNWRDELRFRLWPFLSEVLDAVQEVADEADEPEAIPFELVMRAIGVIVALSQAVRQGLPAEHMEALTVQAAQVTEELMALVDPDDLAEYIQSLGGDNTAEVPATQPTTEIDTARSIETEEIAIRDEEPVHE